MTLSNRQRNEIVRGIAVAILLFPFLDAVLLRPILIGHWLVICWLCGRGLWELTRHLDRMDGGR